MAAESRSLIATAVALLAAATAPAQTPLTLQEANARKSPGMQLVHAGQHMVVQGQVTASPVRFADYAHVAIRDAADFALTLEGPEFMFERVSAGDRIEVRGVLTQRGGLPVLRPEQLTTLSNGPAPTPSFHPIQELQQNEALGRYVSIEGRVMALGEDAGGEYILLDDGQPQPYPVYLPKPATRLGVGLSRYRVSDRVRVHGIASQNATDPPYNNRYRLELNDVTAVSLLERHWLVPPQYLIILLIALLTVGLWFVRQRRRYLARQLAVRRIHNLCEEILLASSVEELRRKLSHLAPRALEASSVELFRYDRGAQVLRQTLTGCDDEAAPIPLDKPASGVAHSISLCFRNRTPLHIPDLRRSALTSAVEQTETRGLVLLPAFAREELSGVVEILHERIHPVSSEELTALQHLANQIAIIWKLLDQQARREQILRSEKLAATGQILSGVASELRAPLESIAALAHRLLDHGESQARVILQESLRAAAILSRLGSAVRQEGEEPAPIELNSLLRPLINELRKDWAKRELRLDLHLSQEKLWVLASESQVEQVLANLILLAARSADNSLDRSLNIESLLRGKRVVVSLRYGALLCDETFPTSPAIAPERQVLGFGICRGILHGMGGDVHLVGAGEETCRMEIDLPAVVPSQKSAPVDKSTHAGRSLTAIILEPDLSAQRRLMFHWSNHGHRAVPVPNEDVAFDLLRRLKTDVIFCALRTGSGNWVEFFERARELAPVFVLVAESMDSDASVLFPDGDGLVLRKPIETGEMERLLERIDRSVDNALTEA